MTKIGARHEPTAAPEKVASAGRFFKFSLKRVPIVDATMETRMKAAARKPRKDRRYPVMVEAPDARQAQRRHTEPANNWRVLHFWEPTSMRYILLHLAEAVRDG